MSDRDRIVAVGFLTEHDLTVLGQGFKRAYPIEDHHGFDAMLREIDAADERRRASDQGDPPVDEEYR